MGLGKHKAEITNPDLDLPGVSSGSTGIIDWDDGEPEKPGLCCLQGCLAGTAVGISFFVALPTGIILIVLAGNSDNTALLAVGCSLVVLPVLVLMVVILLCVNQNKLCCQTRHNKTSHGTAGQRYPDVHMTATSGHSPA